jgi:hypothetical protein
MRAQIMEVGVRATVDGDTSAAVGEVVLVCDIATARLIGAHLFATVDLVPVADRQMDLPLLAPAGGKDR